MKQCYGKRYYLAALLLYAQIAIAATATSHNALPIDYRAMVRAGGIMPDGKVDVMVGQKGEWISPIWGAELSATFYPDWQALDDWSISFRPRTDKQGREIVHRRAGMGVALSYWCFGQSDLMGHAIAPYLFLDIPLLSLPHFVLGLRPGIGCGFLTKTYRNTVPEGHLFQDLQDANRSIGSVCNFHFPEALYMEFPLREGWSLAIEGGWYHFSNGSTVQPNSGYNIFAASVGARKQIQPLQRTKPQALQPTVSNKRWAVEFALTAGARQVYYRDRATFAVAAFSASAYWLAHPIFRLGGGVDVFYDGAYTQRETHFGKTHLAAATPADCWRLGVSIQPEFVVGQFTAGFHFGVYLLDPVKELEPYEEAQNSETGRIENKGIFYPYDLLHAGSAGYPDGWLYTQIVLRYRLPYHLFLQAQMKAHLTKVEFVALGIGAYL